MGTERGAWHGTKMSLYGKDPNGLGEIKIYASDELARDDAGFQY